MRTKGRSNCILCREYLANTPFLLPSSSHSQSHSLTKFSPGFLYPQTAIGTKKKNKNKNKQTKVLPLLGKMLDKQVESHKINNGTHLFTQLLSQLLPYLGKRTSCSIVSLLLVCIISLLQNSDNRSK